MDRVKIFCSKLDIKPKILINQFLRYFGLYIEDITKDSHVSRQDSLIDVHIISDAYVEDYSDNLDIEDENKTILIYMDGWGSVQLENIRSIEYYELGDEEFLKQLKQHMISILSERNDLHEKLIGGVDDLGRLMDSFIEIYVSNEVLQATLFARCFYAQRDFCITAQKKYINFIEQINDLNLENENSDLVKYIFVRAQYELDFICKVNSFSLYYDPLMLEEQCGELLEKYVENETLHILQADISFVLNDAWNKAGYEYSDIRLVDCAYAYYRQGQILHRYVRDRDKALKVYTVAKQKKGDYYAVYNQMGDCYERQGKYSDAIKSYENVREILDNKYQWHILAPLEIYMLFCVTRRIAEIYALIFRNYGMADQYIELSDRIKKETEQDEYFRLVWGENPNAYDNYFRVIKKEIDDRIEAYKNHLNYKGDGSYEYE